MKLEPFGRDLPDAELEPRLRSYEALLRAHAPRLGLLSTRDLDRMWERHILDSLRAVTCLAGAGLQVFDLGSGAGLPGVPVAIARRDSQVLLIEPKARRAAFLELVVERLDLSNARVHVGAADSVRGRADVVLIRAVAAPGEAWRMAEPLLTVSGRVLYFAGRTWGAEQAAAAAREGADARVCVPARLAWEGPVVMMAASQTNGTRTPVADHDQG
ncbi:MAG TPA: 16S rRNA (guanine(527)-N(7))-methyltransferase RsmG [Actinomycetota bacterium]